ncbi:DUF541 domain-containing protein [Natronorubrum sp. JWXQ-INN-674]|uniref:DUF541 domain-containing protein n=1 Tax=Natronorubrum halalkaliphilum TaxID=2691917 RepID=A0A6B0VPP8_9EURY|nr:SIMPL domain-containing protein [Natronorubrum halalkaliphilum]MXV63458.1 DUF541 domain-containing protein [Natronorubrum halalkaliphilum]
MDRRQFLAASGVGVAAATAGCTTDVLGSTEAETGSETETNGREITVSASGGVEAEPDRAVVSVGVTASGESAEAVTDELAEGAQQLRETFDELGIPEENVEEGQYRVHPARGRESDGFEGAHSFDLTLETTDRVGEVIDASVAAGADDIGRVNFTLQDETRDERRRAAIDEALANADAEAAHVADNRGGELVETVAVTTDDVRVRATRYDVAAETTDADDAAPPTEIDADPVSVSATVTVVYRFTD